MKKLFIYFISTFIFSFLFTIQIFADTIITTPLDSRPISKEYLKNLASIASDTVFIAGEDYLDYFTNGSGKDHFANSKQVRSKLNELVKKNDNPNTTVIINTSSYLTGGLVGSRCATNYTDLEKGLDELYEMIQTYPNPSYYLNLVMPRNLPETRGNQIWPNDKKLRGLASYYLLHHKSSPLKDEIEQQFGRVTPSEFLLEWGYVENKAKELGENNLTPWEFNFLQFFRNHYQDSEEYSEYIKNYVIPFEQSAKIFQHIMRWQKRGYLEEVIVSNDDSQLPSSIAYLYQHAEDKDWITLENGSPIKYSFARTFTTASDTSIRQYILRNYNKEESELALEGKSENINFIFGLDEVPQMIYARDLAKRTGLSADFCFTSFSDNTQVESYDVLNAGNLVKNGLNYMNTTSQKTKKTTDLFLFDYAGDVPTKVQQAEKAMFQSYKAGNHVALIELYSYQIISDGTNLLFQTLAKQKSGNTELAITQLSAFSAWNTNANAIGLGLAHAQVYAIAEETRKEKESLLEAQIKMLAQHILEDGIYIGQVKSQLGREGYLPSAEEKEKSTHLYDALKSKTILDIFKTTTYTIEGKYYQAETCQLNQYGFPWERLFDCYIDVNAAVKELKL